MSDAPERIWVWIERDDQGTFIEYISDEPLPPAEAQRESEVPYIRADLHEALQAENAKLKRMLLGIHIRRTDEA